MLSIANHQGNANQNDDEMSVTTHLTFFYDAYYFKRNITSAGKVVEKFHFVYSSWECKIVHLLWKTLQMFLNNLEMELTYDPAIPLYGIYLKELKSES